MTGDPIKQAEEMLKQGVGISESNSWHRQDGVRGRRLVSFYILTPSSFCIREPAVLLSFVMVSCFMEPFRRLPNIRFIVCWLFSTVEHAIRPADTPTPNIPGRLLLACGDWLCDVHRQKCA